MAQLWLLPYFVIALLSAATEPVLGAACLVSSAAIAIAYERLHPQTRWRYPSGWALSLLLLLPHALMWGLKSPWPAVAVLAPAPLLLLAHRLSGRRLGPWWSERPIEGTMIYIGLVALGLWVSAGRLLPRPTDDVVMGLYAAPQSFALTQAEMDAAIGVVETAIEDYQPGEPKGVSARLREQEAELPAALRQDVGRSVHVGLWLGRRGPVRGDAAGGPLYQALGRATSRAISSADRPEAWARHISRVRIQIDIAERARRIHSRPLHRLLVALVGPFTPVSSEQLLGPGRLAQLAYEVEPGLDGLVLRRGDRKALFLPSDPITGGWLTPRVRGRIPKLQTMLARLSERAGGPAELWEQAELYKFRSLSFARTAASGRGRAVRLYRGNVQVDRANSEAIMAGIRDAGRWLRRTVRRDGRFDYEYYPTRNQQSRGYNAVRHVACVYALFFMYQKALVEPALFAEANHYLEAAIQSASWLYDRLKPPPGAAGDELLALVDPPGHATSGAAALALMALLERPPAEQVSHPVLREHLRQQADPRQIEGLGRFLLDMIDRHGKVYGNYRERQEHPEVRKEPLYFPGEVMLVLVRLHRATGGAQWLEGAKRIAQHRMTRFRSSKRTPDHWVMQALWELYDVTGETDYADCCLEMADRYVAEQYPPLWAPFADYQGAYRRIDDLPRTTRACSRSEALGGALHVAWRSKADATAYEDALLQAARHLLENQYGPDNSYYLPRPQKALGAIRMGLVDNHCRIDNNQHALVGLFRALEVARKREGKRAPAEVVLPPVPDAAAQRRCERRLSRRPSR